MLNPRLSPSRTRGQTALQWLSFSVLGKSGSEVDSRFHGNDGLGVGANLQTAHASPAMPHVDQVAWPASRGDQDDVDADVIVWPDVVMRDGVGGGRNAAEAVRVDGEIELRLRPPRFDLDERNNPPPSRDQIDLALANFNPSGNNAPAVEAQPQRGATLAPCAELFGGPTAHIWLTSGSIALHRGCPVVKRAAV